MSCVAGITAVYKRNDSLDKINYPPISVLPVVSKISERIKINNYIISFLSPYLCGCSKGFYLCGCSKGFYLCGCSKGFNTQHALLTLVENWGKSLDNKRFMVHY